MVDIAQGLVLFVAGCAGYIGLGRIAPRDSGVKNPP